MEQSLLQQDIRPCFRASAPLKLPARKLKVASAVNEVHMYWHIFIHQLERAIFSKGPLHVLLGLWSKTKKIL
jgi:hypothetical protein